jgi:MGT family glycosyltransferase
MANLWCISAQLYSHMDWGGYLKTAQALHARGHHVTWISGVELATAAQQAGLAFLPIAQTGWLHPLPPVPDVTKMPPQEAVMLRYRRALDAWLSETLVAEGVQAMIDLAEQHGPPDAIISEMFVSAAAIAADKLNVPLIVCGWPAQNTIQDEFLYPVQKQLAQDSHDRISRLCARFGVQGVNFAHGATPSVLSPHRHISYWCPTWYQAELGTLLPQNIFVGGVVTPPATPPPAWVDALPTDVPLALITLGTVFNGDLGFFSWAAQAVARLGLLPIVALGNQAIAPQEKDKLKAALPKGTRLVNFVPFEHILPRCLLATHHGGMGTTHAIVLHGIPQLVVPHAADQRGQAVRASQAKVGLNLTAHEVRHGALLSGARALLNDARVQQNARDLAAEMAALGGIARAADAVEAIIAPRV